MTKLFFLSEGSLPRPELLEKELQALRISRRESADTQRTDKSGEPRFRAKSPDLTNEYFVARFEVEEASEFLQPVDTAPNLLDDEGDYQVGRIFFKQNLS